MRAIPQGSRILSVRAFPDAGAERVIETGVDAFDVYTRLPPKEGAANKGVILAISRHLALPAGKVSILSGHQKPMKKVLILP